MKKLFLLSILLLSLLINSCKDDEVNNIDNNLTGTVYFSNLDGGVPSGFTLNLNPYSIRKSFVNADYLCVLRNGKVLYTTFDGIVTNNLTGTNYKLVLPKGNTIDSYNYSFEEMTASEDYIVYRDFRRNMRVVNHNGELITTLINSNELDLQHPSFSADGNFILFAGYNKSKGIYILDIEKNQYAKIEGIENSIGSPVYSNDNKLIAYIENGDVRVLDVQTNSIIKNFDPTFIAQALVFSPDNTKILVAAQGTYYYVCDLVKNEIKEYNRTNLPGLETPSINKKMYWWN
jgi:Tol biopolymer transport system component